MSTVPRPKVVPTADRDEWLRLAGRAKLLSWASFGIIGAEALVAITAGIVASSAALIGFGIDSLIEGLASLVIVWRFTGSRLLSNGAEQRAQRLVAIQFFLLAPYIAYEALHDLIGRDPPSVSWVGIALSIVSLISMPLLGHAKQKVGRRMGSAATVGEGAQNILCAYMAAALLVGLLANALFGLWWLDPVAALVIAGMAVREGLETWRGQACTCAAVPTASAPPTASRGCSD